MSVALGAALLQQWASEDVLRKKLAGIGSIASRGEVLDEPIEEKLLKNQPSEVKDSAQKTETGAFRTSNWYGGDSGPSTAMYTLQVLAVLWISVRASGLLIWSIPCQVFSFQALAGGICQAVPNQVISDLFGFGDAGVTNQAVLISALLYPPLILTKKNLASNQTGFIPPRIKAEQRSLSNLMRFERPPTNPTPTPDSDSQRSISFVTKLTNHVTTTLSCPFNLLAELFPSHQCFKKFGCAQGDISRMVSRAASSCFASLTSPSVYDKAKHPRRIRVKCVTALALHVDSRRVRSNTQHMNPKYSSFARILNILHRANTPTGGAPYIIGRGEIPRFEAQRIKHALRTLNTSAGFASFRLFECVTQQGSAERKLSPVPRDPVNSDYIALRFHFKAQASSSQIRPDASRPSVRNMHMSRIASANLKLSHTQRESVARSSQLSKKADTPPE
ncbi:hypothetical protein FB451DRAFT_1371372 [Mycena latifolia]|nr:hypothetical protein FB451DRAFT_1371372 [Mycena latifolia]